MCGNFGLLKLQSSTAGSPQSAYEETPNNNRNSPMDSHSVIANPPISSFLNHDVQKSQHDSMHEVSNLHGIRMAGEPAWTHSKNGKGEYSVAMADLSSHGRSFHNKSLHGAQMVVGVELLSPLKVLEAQTSCTEIRGGQAGGYSSLEFCKKKIIPGDTASPIRNIRVRCVARKRHPLAADLTCKYVSVGGRAPLSTSSLTGKFKR